MLPFLSSAISSMPGVTRLKTCMAMGAMMAKAIPATMTQNSRKSALSKTRP